LLKLKGLEEVNKYSCFSSSSLLVVKIVSVKEWGRGVGSGAQKEAKQRRIWKTYSWLLSGLKFFNRSVITVLYIERTIAIL
jgi:hypothetical protein